MCPMLTRSESPNLLWPVKGSLMPLTTIEVYLFQGMMQHAIKACSTDHDTVVVAIAPRLSETALSSSRTGYVHNARLASREGSLRRHEEFRADLRDPDPDSKAKKDGAENG